MSSALVTLITLLIGLFLGLGLGIWISRAKDSGGSSEKLAQELNDVKVLLKASDERLKMASLLQSLHQFAPNEIYINPNAIARWRVQNLQLKLKR